MCNNLVIKRVVTSRFYLKILLFKRGGKPLIRHCYFPVEDQQHSWRTDSWQHLCPYLLAACRWIPSSRMCASVSYPSYPRTSSTFSPQLQQLISFLSSSFHFSSIDCFRSPPCFWTDSLFCGLLSLLSLTFGLQSSSLEYAQIAHWGLASWNFCGSSYHLSFFVPICFLELYLEREGEKERER